MLISTRQTGRRRRSHKQATQQQEKDDQTHAQRQEQREKEGLRRVGRGSQKKTTTKPPARLGGCLGPAAREMTLAAKQSMAMVEDSGQSHTMMPAEAMWAIINQLPSGSKRLATSNSQQFADLIQESRAAAAKQKGQKLEPALLSTPLSAANKMLKPAGHAISSLPGKRARGSRRATIYEACVNRVTEPNEGSGTEHEMPQLTLTSKEEDLRGDNDACFRAIVVALDGSPGLWGWSNDLPLKMSSALGCDEEAEAAREKSGMK